MSDLTDNLDVRCWSARDLLQLVAAARQVRNPLAFIADALLDAAEDDDRA